VGSACAVTITGGEALQAETQIELALLIRVNQERNHVKQMGTVE